MPLDSSLFFLEVSSGRPYEPTGMTTALWMEIPPRRVRIDDLIGCQLLVGEEGIVHHLLGGTSWCGDPYPHVVLYQGRKWLSDGHHRVAVARLLGKKTIRARVLVRNG